MDLLVSTVSDHISTKKARKFNLIFCPLKPDEDESTGQIPSSGTL